MCSTIFGLLLFSLLFFTARIYNSFGYISSHAELLNMIEGSLLVQLQASYGFL